MTGRFTLAGLAALILSACAQSAVLNVDPVHDRYEAETARLLCNADGLASERSAAIQTLDQTADDLAGTTDSTRESSSILRSKLIAFEAEVEGAHRNVVMACQVYARCMEANENDEGACYRAQTRWDQASDGFQDLTIAIRQLSTEVQLAQVDAQVAIARAEEAAEAARARAAAAAAAARARALAEAADATVVACTPGTRGCAATTCRSRCRTVANVFTAGCGC